MINTKKYLLHFAVGCACANFLFPSCNGSHQNASWQTDSLRIDTVYHLQGRTDGPSCSLSCSYAFFRPSSTNDTLADLLNGRLRKAGFGDQFEGLAPEAFVDALAASYLTEYREDVESLYQEDVARGTAPEDLPMWYNYEFDFQTLLKPGKGTVWNFSVLNFSYTGGAHPMTYRKCVNIDTKTGHIYTKEEVFDLDHESDICRLILQELIAEANRRLETDTITSVEGLQENGMLLNDGGLFVPDNFLLKENHVTFVYNRYDIAPYSAGDFLLSVSNEQLAPYLKPQN